jgi:hypothetical protein
MSQTLEITLKIRCHNLPGVQVGERTAVRLGIQKRQEVIEDVAADVEEAIFFAPIRVEFKDTDVADFYGPFVHGKPGERFLYLCWGERNGKQWEGFSRAKLQLLPIPHTLLFRASDNNSPLEVSLTMTDEKGKIICATIKEKQLFWQT